MSKLSKSRVIGSGAYGKVYGAKDTQGETYAVKRLLVDDTVKGIGSLMEADMISRFKHPHIVKAEVKLGSVFECPLSPVATKHVKDDKICFVMEEALGDAYGYMKGVKDSLEVKRLMVHLLLGLEYMHAKGASHQDLKPQNILYFKDSAGNLTFKIADLGLAYWNNRYGYQSPTVSTSWYRAPEVVNGCRYTSAIDMWSVGCMLYEFIFGTPMLAKISKDDNTEIYKAYSDIVPGFKSDVTWDRFWTIHRMRFNVSDFPYLRPLFEGMLRVNAKERLTATEALNSYWFRDFHPYIFEMRYRHPPIMDPYPLICTSDQQERVFCVGAINLIFQHHSAIYREEEKEHFRCLFHAIMLFDRYLIHTINTTPEPPYEKITEKNGRYWSMDGTYMRFMACYHTAYKYFGLMKSNLNWEALVGKDYNSPHYMQLAEQTETYLSHVVCRYLIYQPTPLDIAGYLGIELTPRETWSLIRHYLLFTWSSCTSEMILNSFLATIHYQANKI